MMNVEGAAIEKQSDKTILPLFHAFFSFGTVIGAGLGVARDRPGRERPRAPEHHGGPHRRHRLRQHRERPRPRDHDRPPTRMRSAAGASACTRAVGLARAAHLRARRHHARHGVRRGRRERLARARRGRGPRRRPGARRRRPRRLLGQHDRRPHARRPARRPVRPRRDPARARGDRGGRPAAVHPRPERSRSSSSVRRCGAPASRSASRSACRPPPTTRPRPPRA